MYDEKECRFCYNMRTKDTFFSGRKYYCDLRNCKVDLFGSCPNFIRDGNKVLSYVGFRQHSRESEDGCSNCVNRGSFRQGNKAIYTCKINDIQFNQDFPLTAYICDNYENGGKDSFISYIAEIFK